MSYEQVKKIEEYLYSKKRKTPEHVKYARSHLYLYGKKAIQNGENYKEELRIIRTHYQGQLANLPAIGSYLAISAIIISLVVGLFSLSSSSRETMLVTLATLVLLFSMTAALRYIEHNYKKSSVYTIIISLIDEILEDAKL
jgi:hypothetical protein